MTYEVRSRIYAVLEKLRLLMSYLEYGEPKKTLPRAPLKTLRRNVWAVELKEIEGLANHRIADRLEAEGFDLEMRTDSFVDDDERKEKRGRKARDIAGKGREILEEGLGSKGFEEHVGSARAEKERHAELDDEDRLVQRLADMLPDAEWSIWNVHREALREIFSRVLNGERPGQQEYKDTFSPTHYHSSTERRPDAD